MADPEDTGKKREDVGFAKPPAEHRFQPGNSGRPKGSRNKLGDAFVTDLLETWQVGGKAVIERVMEERPQDYLKVVASILPKQVEIKEGAFDGLSDDELSALVLAARSALGVAGGGGSRGDAEGEPQPTEGLPAVH